MGWWHRRKLDPLASVDRRLLATAGQLVEAFRAFEPVEVILTGSRAYGQPRPTSDADLLLIVKRQPPTDAEDMVAALANDLENDLGFLPHIKASTPENVRAGLESGERYVSAAIGMGIVVYPPGRRRSDFFRFLRASRRG